ncbi:ATP-grasp domain-containing protein [Aliamphritea spongicola]|uniref:ATP-grasp domain-containing protein n=1 Tax=Aliamphritea spongicola TaxID=707589 RepID=UPI00196A4F9B|nr:ATP-grasp domain-containing protein [Aliamphritea spongicola]MBN3561106.1 ATP-grasp domain-containing protein [Aliamphritea spongicola]
MDEIIHVGGDCLSTLRPALEFGAIAERIEAEIGLLGSAEGISIYCQQEDNLMVAARLRQAYGIAGDRPEQVELFRDKLAMKNRVGQSIIGSIPRHRRFDMQRYRDNCHGYFQILSEYLGPRMVIKPVSGAGSVNVAIIESYSDFEAFGALLDETHYGFEYEVDEFISGTMYQCDSVIVDGGVKFSSVLELGCTNFEFVQGQPLSFMPSIPAELSDLLKDFNRQVLAALGLENGITHHEFFYDHESGKITFLEIAMRVPGTIVVPLHADNCGINLMDCSLYLAANKRWLNTLQTTVKNDRFAALLPVGHGEVTRLHQPDLESDFGIDWFVSEGTSVDLTDTVQDQAGVLRVYNTDPRALRRDFKRLQHFTATTCR